MNRGITVLQTAALATWLCRRKIKWSGRTDLNRRRLPWQGSTLPLSYARSLETVLNITNRCLLSIKIIKTEPQISYFFITVNYQSGYKFKLEKNHPASIIFPYSGIIL